MHPSQIQRFAGQSWLVVGLCLVTATWGFAQSQPSENAAKSPTSSAAAKAPKSSAPTEAANVAMTPERQAAALKFAELHHPELYQLIQGLKKARRPEYQKAVRQLYLDSERLARIKERAADRYELALTEWQLDSRVRLIVARMTMSSGDPELEGQLRELLQKRLDTRLALLKLDRERHAARLAKMDDQIQELESDREATIQRDLVQIQRSLGVGKTRPKKPVGANSPASNSKKP